jgi:hypothetical protein
VRRLHRRDRFLVRVPPERVFDLAGDPSRFPEFNPLVEVPEREGRVEQVGNVYHQVVRLGPMRLSSRWETTQVHPANLADRPPPAPPWTTVEVGELPFFGRFTSTSRYDARPAGTLITHDLEYGVPGGLPGRVIDLLVARPLLSVGMGFLGRRMCRWLEAGRSTGIGSAGSRA